MGARLGRRPLTARAFTVSAIMVTWKPQRSRGAARDMNVPVGRVRDARLHQDRVGLRAASNAGKVRPSHARQKAPRRRQPRSEVASTAPMDPRRAVADSGFDSVQLDRVGELSRLAARL